jgi:hypothetical protein
MARVHPRDVTTHHLASAASPEIPKLRHSPTIQGLQARALSPEILYAQTLELSVDELRREQELRIRHVQG